MLMYSNLYLVKSAPRTSAEEFDLPSQQMPPLSPLAAEYIVLKPSFPGGRCPPRISPRGFADRATGLWAQDEDELRDEVRPPLLVDG
jgi:hypothetical protein